MVSVPMRIGELRLVLDAPGDVVDWIVEVFAAAFDAVDREPTRRVVARLDDRATRDGDSGTGQDQHASAERIVFVRDGPPVTVDALIDEAGGGSIDLGDASVAWDPDRMTIAVHATDLLILRNRVFEVVRELAMAAHSHTGVVLHAACAGRNDRTFVICGPRRSGKTSFVAHLAADGGSLVANDRTILARSPDGGFGAIGLPTIVSVRPGTVERLGLELPWPASAWQCRRTLAELQLPGPPAEPAYRWSLSLAQLATVIGADLKPSTQPVILVLPRIDPSEDLVRIEQIDRAAAIEALMGQVLGNPGERVSEVFGNEAPGEADIIGIVADLAAAVPVIGLRLGRAWHRIPPDALADVVSEHAYGNTDSRPKR